MEVEDFKSAVLIEKINMMNIYEWGSKITVGEKKCLSYYPFVKYFPPSGSRSPNGLHMWTD